MQLNSTGLKSYFQSFPETSFHWFRLHNSPPFGNEAWGRRNCLQFTIAAALHIVKSISQQDSDGVTAFLHLRGDIISIIIDTFVIVAPKGGKFAVSHFFSIQRKLVKAQATYIRCGVFHFFCHMELAAQINTFLCQSIHSTQAAFASGFFSSLP